MCTHKQVQRRVHADPSLSRRIRTPSQHGCIQRTVDLDGRNVDGPSDLVWSRLHGRGLTLLAGRNGRPIHARERERLDLLARLADALI